jgi:hypothetical protein
VYKTLFPVVKAGEPIVGPLESEPVNPIPPSSASKLFGEYRFIGGQ